jgi:hypothetical protein
MPTASIIAIISGISAGLLTIGGSCVVLTLGIAGLCTMFAWMDTHIGGFVKRVFTSVLLGGSIMGGAGALGLWMASQFGMSGAAPAAPAAGLIMLSLFG